MCVRVPGQQALTLYRARSSVRSAEDDSGCKPTRLSFSNNVVAVDDRAGFTFPLSHDPNTHDTKHWTGWYESESHWRIVMLIEIINLNF